MLVGYYKHISLYAKNVATFLCFKTNMSIHYLQHTQNEVGTFFRYTAGNLIAFGSGTHNNAIISTWIVSLLANDHCVHMCIMITDISRA